MNNTLKIRKEFKMENKIGMAIQEGDFVRVYSENGSCLFTIGGELVGYTSCTVSIKEGSFIRVYDSTGSYQFSR